MASSRSASRHCSTSRSPSGHRARRIDSRMGGAHPPLMDGATLGILAVRAFVVVTMASFGLLVAGRELTGVLRRPSLVLPALVANLILVPLVAVALALVLGL